LNEALEWAQGEYFAVTDSDDILQPEKTLTLLRAIDGCREINGVFGGVKLITSDGRFNGAVYLKERIYNFSDILERDKQMISSCALLRTEALRAAGGYLSGLYIEDWYIMLRLTEGGGRLKTIPAPLALYRQHSTNISKDALKMFESRMFILDLFSSYPGSRPRKALVCVEAAIDFCRKSKRSSFVYLGMALRLQPAISRRKIFWSAVFRTLAPVTLLDMLKEAKMQLGSAS
jgi:alpha-1,3-rhamnosyltransferase